MGSLSKYFNRSEFACKCGCGFDTVDHELIVILEDVREHFGAPVAVNSGCRCHVYNRKIGGSTASQHIEGRAADITVSGHTPSEVQAYLLHKYPGQYGIGSYNSFTHIDSRPVRARWHG